MTQWADWRLVYAKTIVAPGATSGVDLQVHSDDPEEGYWYLGSLLLTVDEALRLAMDLAGAAETIRTAEER